MKRTAFTLLIISSLILLYACSGRDPGPLAGKWEQVGPITMEVQFRPGEIEMSGVIDKVRYEVKGEDVLVTYTDGPMKGKTVHYVMVGQDMAKADLGTLRRMKEK
jgi:hypothetical protein